MRLRRWFISWQYQVKKAVYILQTTGQYQIESHESAVYLIRLTKQYQIESHVQLLISFGSPGSIRWRAMSSCLSYYQAHKVVSYREPCTAVYLLYNTRQYQVENQEQLLCSVYLLQTTRQYQVESHVQAVYIIWLTRGRAMYQLYITYGSSGSIRLRPLSQPFISFRPTGIIKIESHVIFVCVFSTTYDYDLFIFFRINLLAVHSNGILR